jgi:hypothetical protein
VSAIRASFVCCLLALCVAAACGGTAPAAAAPVSLSPATDVTPVSAAATESPSPLPSGELPPELPKALPQYPRAVLESVGRGELPHSFVITYGTDDTFDQVEDFYFAELVRAGWSTGASRDYVAPTGRDGKHGWILSFTGTGSKGKIVIGRGDRMATLITLTITLV